MRRKLTYTALVKTATLVCFLFAMPLCASASDTTHIAFTSERDGNNEIYIMDTKGKNLRNLTNHPARDSQPAFSPDGQWMAYVSDRDGNSRIYLMNRNNNVIRPLTTHLASKGDLDPNWSPDGQWIAFTFIQAQAGIQRSRYNIYKINVNTGNLQQLTDTEYNRDPAWSPDGDQIMFFSDGKERHDLYVMKANGKGLRRVIIRNPGGYSPAWSPDGKQIAYERLGLEGRGIYIMTTEGQNDRRVTPKNTWGDNPAWSPDGPWIAYELELKNPWGNPNRDSDIYLVSSDGTKTRQLTKHPARDRYPAWVPENFLSVSPTVEKQTSLWGTLKKSGIN